MVGRDEEMEKYIADNKIPCPDLCGKSDFARHPKIEIFLRPETAQESSLILRMCREPAQEDSFGIAQDW